MNKKTQKLVSFSIIVLLFSSMIPTMIGDCTISRATVFVDDDAILSWYDSTHVRTIQEGINNATIGDTVYVYNGTYYEHVIINKTITLIGENKTTTIIDGSDSGDVITTQVDNITISLFTIRNAGNQPISYAGILIESNNNQITDTIIKNNDIYGIYIVSSNDNTIENNNLNDNGEGIRLYNSTTNIISNNTITNNYYGIRDWYSDQNSIINNSLSSNEYYGIFLKESQLTNIINNTISNGDNEGYGIRLWNGQQSVLHSNIITDYSVGLYFDNDSHNHTIYNNYLDNTNKKEKTQTTRGSPR